MWKPEHRVAAERRGLRYESDLTKAEWALVGPLIRPAKRGGRPRRSRGPECDLLCALDRLPMEGAAKGPAAAQHRLGIPGSVAVGRNSGAHPPRALCGGAGAGGPRGEPDDGNHR